MSTYIMLSKLTDHGRQTVRTHPERIMEVTREAEALGAHLISQWPVLGPYEFVNLIEAPDNETIARLSLELGSRGTVEFLTLPVLPGDVFLTALEKKELAGVVR